MSTLDEIEADVSMDYADGLADWRLQLLASENREAGPKLAQMARAFRQGDAFGAG